MRKLVLPRSLATAVGVAFLLGSRVAVTQATDEERNCALGACGLQSGAGSNDHS